MKAPTIHFDRPKADAAYQAHIALIALEEGRPDLVGNEYWQALRDAAYARFRAAFEAE